MDIRKIQLRDLNADVFIAEQTGTIARPCDSWAFHYLAILREDRVTGLRGAT